MAGPLLVDISSLSKIKWLRHKLLIITQQWRLPDERGKALITPNWEALSQAQLAWSTYCYFIATQMFQEEHFDFWFDIISLSCSLPLPSLLLSFLTLVLCKVRRHHFGPRQHLFGRHCNFKHSQHAWRLQPVGRDQEEEELQPHEQEGSGQDARQYRHWYKGAQILCSGWVN